MGLMGLLNNASIEMILVKSFGGKKPFYAFDYIKVVLLFDGVFPRYVSGGKIETRN